MIKIDKNTNLAVLLDNKNRAVSKGTPEEKEEWYNVMNVVTRYANLAAKIKDSNMMLVDLMQLLEPLDTFEADVLKNILWVTVRTKDEYPTWHLDQALGLIDLFNKKALSIYIGLDED